MAELKGLGRILGVIGGLIMVIFSIIIAISNLVEELLENMQDIVDLTTFNITGQSLTGEGMWIASVVITAVCGLIAIYGYNELGKGRSKDPSLLWGIVFIIIGLIGGTIGGLIVLIAGIILVLDYFI